MVRKGHATGCLLTRRQVKVLGDSDRPSCRPETRTTRANHGKIVGASGPSNVSWSSWPTVGLKNRGRRDRAVAPIGVSALANILSNKAYDGIVSWEGIDYPGLHQPLVDTATFNKVQDLLAARATRGTRERRHNHYLKGTLFCGVCGRGLSFQLAKGRYEYLYCLGQKNRNPTGCQEPYMAAGDLEAQVEQLYEKIELPKSWLKRLREELEAEITARQHRNAAEREFLTRKLAKADTERRKLLDAYYAGAIDVTTLKAEQARIAADVRSAEERLAAVDAHLAEWQEILETAMRFATNCAKAYARASVPTRRRFNQAVFTRIEVRDGKITDVGYHPPFELLFSSSRVRIRRFGGDDGTRHPRPPACKASAWGS